LLEGREQIMENCCLMDVVFGKMKKCRRRMVAMVAMVAQQCKCT
jgi:hypothetical protein